MDGLLCQSERTRVKLDGHSISSGRSLGINQRVASKESKWMVKEGQNERYENVKVDEPKESKWMVQECQTGRYENVKVDDSKGLKWTAKKY